MIQLVLLVIYHYFIHSSVYKVSIPPETLPPPGVLVEKVSGLREKGCSNRLIIHGPGVGEQQDICYVGALGANCVCSMNC